MGILIALTIFAIVAFIVLESYTSISNALCKREETINHASGLSVIIFAICAATLYPFYCIYTHDYVTAFQSFVVSSITAVALYYTLQTCARIERRFSDWYHGE
jgi:choline-glycine betaine transporter